MTAQEAIQELERTDDNGSALKYMVAIGMAIEALKRTQWIPCSERLPENSRSVLIFSKNGGVAEGCYTEAKGWLQFRWIAYVDAIAWMPLPEPYREEKKKMKYEVEFAQHTKVTVEAESKEEAEDPAAIMGVEEIAENDPHEYNIFNIRKCEE